MIKMVPGMLVATSLHAATLCVSTNAVTPTPPHDTWGTAFTSIQQALNTAQSNDIILLAGHRFPLTIQLVWTSQASHVTIRGGFAATNLAVAGGDNNPGRWPTVIQQTAADRVWLIRGVTNGVLDKVTLTGGNPTAASGEWNGVGLYVERCKNLVLSSCIITNNRMLLSNATKRGGGIYSLSNNWLVVSNCLVRDNHLSGNTGGNSIGGGICNSFGSLRCLNTEISGNSVTRSSIGAALFNYGTSLLENCLVYGNTMTGAQPGKVGILDNFALAGGRLSVVNCTIVSNTFPATTGSGLRTASPSLSAATNTIFWQNGDDDLNGAASLGYCAVQTTDAFWTNGVKGCMTSYPRFVNPAQGNFRLQPTSPCRDAGMNISGITSLSRDLDGNQRLSGIRVDIGSYEFPTPVTGSIFALY